MGLIQPASSAAGAGATQTNLYENRDTPQNYFSVHLPSNAAVVHGDKPSSLVVTFKDGTHLSVELADILDTTTTQLYILTQHEPRIKSALKEYSKISIGQQNQTDSNVTTWHLEYAWKNGTQSMKSIDYYIEGQDHTALLSFSAPSITFDSNNSTITAIQQNFRWLA